MAGLRALVCLSFSGAVALTFVLLACALPGYNNWWPLFTLLFYVLTPFPYVIAKRYVSDSAAHSPCMEAAVFITAGLVMSAFGLPIVLARNPAAAPVLTWGAAWLVISGNLVMFLTLLAYFVVFHRDDEFSAASSIW